MLNQRVQKGLDLVEIGAYRVGRLKFLTRRAPRAAFEEERMKGVLAAIRRFLRKPVPPPGDEPYFTTAVARGALPDAL